ncbi:hypothetical protein M758_4G086700 [Ceratodon purpureus]|nr:hypothetical protein M758_4G086700 [Ceratodon purpureus]
MPAEWAAAAARAGARSAAPTPMPSSPKQVPKQVSVPASSANTPPSSLPPIKKQPAANKESTPAMKPEVINAWGPGPKERQPLPEKVDFNTKKKQFEEKLIKDRLVKRDFNYVRHDPYYQDLTRPEKESPAFADYHRKEFWRTDVERVIKKDEDKRKAREQELLKMWTNEEAWRRHRAAKIREIKYNAYVDLQEKMQRVGCRPNKSGAPHINIITRQPIGVEVPEEPPTYFDDVKKYKSIQRKLLLRQKMSGARNFNILNWNENPPGPALPPWPEKPPTPPPPPPPKPAPPNTNSSKWAVSYGRLFGPFGVVDIN